MSEPRAHRTVAPTDLRRRTHGRRARGGVRAARPVHRVRLRDARARGRRRCSACGRSPSARRRPTRSISCASPHAGCASRCGCSAACCRAGTSRASARTCAGSRARSATCAISTSTRRTSRPIASACRPSSAASLSGYELYLRRERADARQRATAVVREPAHERRCSTTSRDSSRAAPSAAALRRWRSLTVRDGIRASIRRSAARVRRLGTGLDARSRAHRAARAAHQSETVALRARILRRGVSARSSDRRRPAKLCKSCSARIKTRTRPRHDCAVTQTC